MAFKSKDDVLLLIEQNKQTNPYYLENQNLFDQLVQCVSKFNWRNKLNAKPNCEYYQLYVWVMQHFEALLPNNSLSTKINWLLTNRTCYPICKVCGKQLTYDIAAISIYSKWCSPICSNRDNDKKLKIQQSFLDHFGVPHAMQCDSIKAKYQQSIRQNYGCDWYVQTNKFKESAQKTYVKNYGVDHNMKSKEFYDLKYRKHFEEIGLWIPNDSKSDYEIYYDLANWKKQMFDFIDDPNQLTLLKEYGVFNPQTNTKGIVRDHIYSRDAGFKNKVFPEILRHPCNCQLISHRDNTIKRKSCGMTLDELFTKILEFDKIWYEQSICIEQILNYKQGKRWVNPYKNQ